MKIYFIYLLPLILISACSSTTSSVNPSSPPVKSQRIQITEIDTNKYNIRYNGLLKDSLQDTQENWMETASKACKGNNFLYEVTKQGFVSNYKEQPAKVSADLSGLCVTGGAVGCIIASLLNSDSYNSKSVAVGSSFAAVEGVVTCQTN